MRQSIVHIALVVRDYDEAIEFYTKKLNFELVEDSYQPEQDKRMVQCWSQCTGKGYSYRMQASFTGDFIECSGKHSGIRHTK